MFELIRAHQLNIMLILCGACGILMLLLFNTRFLSKSRKWILIFMELVAFFPLWFDRLAYIYAGDTSTTGYIMVRLSNFLVYFLTSGIVLGLTMYLWDHLIHEGGLKDPPRRLVIIATTAALGMILAIIAAFTGLYYYFDETNTYHRGAGFLIAYIIPVICPIVLYTVIRQYRESFSKLVYISMVLYIFVPISCGILQIFTYGISIVNMSMVAVSISLYFCTYLDINNDVEHAHKIEMEHMEGEQIRMKRLFDQTATAFVSAVEKKDDFTKGNAVKVADYAMMIAEMCGKDEEYCEKTYYTALLHDVGLIGIPDSVIKNEGDPDKWDAETMHKKPEIGNEILSAITEYPYLAVGAHYSHERYNGTGYPEGLKGEEIPEIARIIAVADAYVTMTTKKRFRDARPDFLAREAFVKGAGIEFDPLFAKTMVKILDSGLGQNATNAEDPLETELVCDKYRKTTSVAIPVDTQVKKIRFQCESTAKEEGEFSTPSIILFDSFDRRIHSDEKTIKEYHYLEYGEIWFDGHIINTSARRVSDSDVEKKEHGFKKNKSGYEILAKRFDDHVQLTMSGPEITKVYTIALPDSSKSSYISLTGEHCRLYDISAEPSGEETKEGDIERIADVISYLDHMESDLKNIQIDGPQAAATEGVELKKRIKLAFHTESLPGTTLVWQCPYVALYTSDDGLFNGENYKKYNIIKLNGENEGDTDYAKNNFTMKHTDAFPGWDAWKELNKEGLEIEINIERRDNRVKLTTENLGVRIESISYIKNPDKIYVALTGDQVALTDIRVNSYTSLY